jgi:toxin FitB
MHGTNRRTSWQASVSTLLALGLNSSCPIARATCRVPSGLAHDCLDTKVVAALITNGTDIDPRLANVPRHELYTTVMTRTEIRYGLGRLPAGKHRRRLTEEADALFRETEERLLTFDARAADRDDELPATRELAGRPVSVADAIIASIAWFIARLWRRGIAVTSMIVDCKL